MKIEQLEKEHFSDVDLSSMEPGGALHFTAEEVQTDPATVLSKLCGIYQKIRPFLNWTTKFFLIPKKIKAVVVGFMEGMDKVCPQS